MKRPVKTFGEFNKPLRETYFYFPLGKEDWETFKEVCGALLYPHGSKHSLSKQEFLETLKFLGEEFYEEHNRSRVPLPSERNAAGQRESEWEPSEEEEEDGDWGI